MSSSRNIARLAGLFWLLNAVTTGFSLGYVRAKLIVSGDAAATSANLVASESLFRAAIVCSLFTQIFLFLLGLTLYRWFKDVHKTWATVMFASIGISVVIAAVNTLNSLGALLVLSPADYLLAFPLEQRNAMAMIFLRLGNLGLGLQELFLAPFFFAFGSLILKSRYLPKIFGILLLLSSVGFPVNTLTKLLVPGFHPAGFTQFAQLCGGLGGVPVILWLLIMGAKDDPSDG